jgi:hypothetical protein
MRGCLFQKLLKLLIVYMRCNFRTGPRLDHCPLPSVSVEHSKGASLSNGNSNL